MARLIDNLELLAKGRMGDLKRICGVDDEDLADMVRELRAYDPKPGAVSVSRLPSRLPRRFRSRTRAGFAVELNGAALPRLLVNRRYYQELRSGRRTRQSKAWLSECLASANWLVRALDQRARTIVKVVSEDRQDAEGLLRPRRIEALKPLTLRQVADAIEMHESTVSRVTSNKYLLCDRGLFELKYFFGSGVASPAARRRRRGRGGQGGDQGIIDRETEILSDDAIAACSSSAASTVARRTVVKYREAMGSARRSSGRQRKIAGG
jgi:RNA polymerase sigma-54 factor